MSTNTERYIRTKRGYFNVDTDGVVRLYSNDEGFYSVHHGLTARQERWVRSHAKPDGERVRTEPEAARQQFGWD